MEKFVLGTYAISGTPPFAAFAVGGRLVSVAVACARFAAGRPGSSILPATDSLFGLLQDWDRSFALLCEAYEFLQARGLANDPTTSLPAEAARVMPPIMRPSKMLYAAANYPTHVAGMRAAGFTGGAVDKDKSALAEKGNLRPYAFLKAPSCIAGAFDDIALPEGWDKIDWEVELAVAIGRPGKRIKAERAIDHIAGYMTTNDVSCRSGTWRDDRPTVRSDWLAGKSHDGFAPMGPYFVPRAFVPDHANLRLWLQVNGAKMQDGNTREMTFGVDEQIEYASSLMTLEPADVLATGTPAGTGQERGQFIKSGDIVECEVDGLGCMRNRFV